MNRNRREVWITGIGVVTASGIGIEPFRAALRAGESPIRRIDRFDPSSFRSQVAAQVDEFDPATFMDARSVRGLDRFSQFAVAAGRLALDDAGLVPDERGHAAAGRIGIYLGSALGGIAFAEEQHERYLERGIRSKFGFYGTPIRLLTRSQTRKDAARRRPARKSG
jgi:3-oxoacyl-[acyl-carrier-protein] synthase II